MSVSVEHDGGDVGDCGGRVLHSTDYGSGGDGFLSGWLFKYCRSAIVKCSLCDGGGGIDGVEVMVMMIVWY